MAVNNVGHRDEAAPFIPQLGHYILCLLFLLLVSFHGERVSASGEREGPVKGLATLLAPENLRKLLNVLLDELVRIPAKLEQVLRHTLSFLRSIVFPQSGYNSAESSSGSGAVTFESVPQIESDQDLDNALQKHEKIFIMAHMEQCGHCRAMHKDYAEFSEALKSEYPDESKVRAYTYNGAKQNIHVARISSHVRGFPTLMVLSKTKSGGVNLDKYEGPRKVKPMMDFVADQFIPIRITESNEELITQMSKAKDATVVHYLGDVSLETATELARGLSRKNIFYVSKKSVLGDLLTDDQFETLSHKSTKHVALAFNKNKFLGKLNSAPNAAPAAAQINMLKRKAIGRFSDPNFMQSELGRYLVLVRLASNMATEAKKNILSEAALKPEILGDSTIVIMDSSNDDDKRIISMVNLVEENDVDSITIFNRETSKKATVNFADITSQTTADEIASQFAAFKESLKFDFKNALVSTASPCIVAVNNLKKSLKEHKTGFLYVYSIVKHKQGRERFMSLRNMLDSSVPLLAIDTTLEEGMNLPESSISANEEDGLYLFHDGKITENVNLKKLSESFSLDNIKNFVTESLSHISLKSEETAAEVTKEAAPEATAPEATADL